MTRMCGRARVTASGALLLASVSACLNANPSFDEDATSDATATSGTTTPSTSATTSAGPTAGTEPSTDSSTEPSTDPTTDPSTSASTSGVGTTTTSSGATDTSATLATGETDTSSTTAAGPAFPDDWLYRQKIQFNTLTNAVDLLDFPVLIPLAAPDFDFSHARPDGADLRFVDDDEVTVLAHETEVWIEGQDPLARIWVRVPTLDQLSDQDHIWLYYGSPDATPGDDPGAVWTADYWGVWHLSTLDDSTSLEHHALDNQGATMGPGRVGDGHDFDGAASIDLPTPNAPGIVDTSDGHASIWFRADVPPNDIAHVFYLSDVVTGDGHGAENELHGNLKVSGQFQGFACCNASNAQGPVAGEGGWHHALLSWTLGDSKPLKVFFDGAPVSTNENQMTLFDFTALIRLGRPGAAERFFTGTVDEFRLSTAARDETWAKTEFITVDDPASFLSFGAEEPL